jgi:SNF2 family DNA or RNA helicase
LARAITRLALGDDAVSRGGTESEERAHLSISQYVDHKEVGKMSVLAFLLRQCAAKQSRVLLFSKTMRILDYAQALCQGRGYEQRRLDGSTSLTERTRVVKDFQSGKVFVLLVSTKGARLKNIQYSL